MAGRFIVLQFNFFFAMCQYHFVVLYTQPLAVKYTFLLENMNNMFFVLYATKYIGNTRNIEKQAVMMQHKNGVRYKSIAALFVDLDFEKL